MHEQFKYFLGKRYGREKTIGHGKKTAGQIGQQIQTADRIAEETGTSAATVKRAPPPRKTAHDCRHGAIDGQGVSVAIQTGAALVAYPGPFDAAGGRITWRKGSPLQRMQALQDHPAPWTARCFTWRPTSSQDDPLTSPRDRSTVAVEFKGVLPPSPPLLNTGKQY